jgi:hypothetical protein
MLGALLAVDDQRRTVRCPHCAELVDDSLDEQHRHATGRCLVERLQEPSRARDFLDRQYDRLKHEQALREQARAAEASARQRSAAKRVENANAKRARKAACRKTKSTHTER